jgi:hypothetical protein
LAKLKSSHRKQKKGFGEVYERRLGWRRVLVVRKVTKTANREGDSAGKPRGG